jgi:hypothetical protein
MGAAPAEDSYSKIAQVAACIRALLSIVNRHTDVHLRAVHRDWIVLCHPNFVRIEELAGATGLEPAASGVTESLADVTDWN